MHKFVRRVVQRREGDHTSTVILVRIYHYVSNCKCSIALRETLIIGQTLQDLNDNYLIFTIS